MKPKKRGFGAGVGGIMVFTVLSVLCVAVFAVLSMSSALADLRLTEKTADMTRQYYELDVAGVRLLCRAEELWPEGSTMPAEDVFYQGFEGLFENAEISLYLDEDTVGLTVFAPVDESRTFEISAYLSASADADTGSRWTVESWTLGASGFEEVDVGMPVWIG